MSVESVTANRGYQLPHPDNDLADDVLRLVAALAAVDIDMAGVLVAIGQRALLLHSHVIADTTGLQAALDSKQDENEKGNANGYASLDATGKVPSTQLPATIFGSLNYQGDWNANTNTPTIPAASSANKGWYFMVSVAGATNVGGFTDWQVGDWVVSSGTKWAKIDNTDAVASVAGLVGAISASSLKLALALDNINNTSDANKPVSTAQATAISSKADKSISVGAGGLATGGGDLSASRTISVPKSSNAQALAGVDDTTAMTPARVKDAIATLPFSKFFESTQQAVTTNGVLTIAHGLGVKPKLYMPCLQCVTAEHGYSIGDEISINPGWTDAGNVNRGISIFPDATNIGIHFASSSSCFTIVPKSAASGQNPITNANWKLVVRALA